MVYFKHRIIMNLHANRSIVLKWFENRLSFPEDSAETKALKVMFALLLTSNIPTLAASGLAFWIFGLKHVSIAMLLFTSFELLIAVSYIIHRKNTLAFVLVNHFFFIVFSFVAVLYFGGIMYSGGVVLVGLTGVLSSVYFLKSTQIRILLIAYVVTIILEVLLQPYLVPLPEITPTANLILFVLHLFVITIVFLNWLNIFIKQKMLLKTKEVEHLQELNKVKTDFYTRITHEFRTPLTVILGYTNPSAKMSDTDFQQMIPVIRKNGIRLLQLVDKMLKLSRMESKAMQLNLIQSDILSYIRQLIETIEYMAKEKNIRLRLRTRLTELKMDFDPDKIDSLLNNLISNALKYSPGNTSVYIVVASIPGYSTKEFNYCVFPDKRNNHQHHLQLTVKDSGYGIEESEIPLVFNRFYQSAANKHQNSGAGIGLFIVKELVHLLDGNLFISSQPDKGTEITVLLPVTNKAEISKAVCKETQSLTDNTRNHEISEVQPDALKEHPLILIIEDNNDIVNYLKTITAKSYQIIRAENGRLGIETALNMVPDIIISDVLMPEKNGFEVCETLKNDFRTSHIPIILLTAKADFESKMIGLNLGADYYLPKPFDRVELETVIKNLISNREKLKAKYTAVAIMPDQSKINYSNPDEIFLYKLSEVMQNNYMEDSFGTKQLTRQMGMSRVQLFRKLKALTGMSASTFIRLYRLTMARFKIEKTGMSISEIAYVCGFSDPAYFSHAFKNEFGLSPSKIRS
jgi:signal transduction histidine kinase/AraC-like DNA-binding protein